MTSTVERGAGTPARASTLRAAAALALASTAAGFLVWGYLFLQAPDAVTDSSGIAYLPEGFHPERTGLSRRDLTPLGGPWWGWTCHC